MRFAGFQNQDGTSLHANGNKGDCGISRREFLGGCAACAGGMATLAALGTSPVAAAATDKPLYRCGPKAKVRLVFTHIPPGTPTWPHINYDYELRKKELYKKLQQACPDVEFLPATVQNAGQAEQILQQNKQVDGYVVYMLGLWTQAPQIIAKSGRPTVFVDDLYGGSGEFLIAYSAMKRDRATRMTGVASSRFEDVAEAVNTFVCLRKLKSSKILVVGERWADFTKPIKEHFGTELIGLDYEELDRLYEKADQQEASQWAERWIDQAEKVVEPTRREIEKSGAMYLALRTLLEKYDAQAVAVRCLQGLYSGKLKAYPCLGFFQLDNDGWVGACEADERSAFTKLLMTYLVGRPGYISDPVIDTGKNQIIYAHCVATNKVFGPEGPANPYHIRNHSEDRRGASVCSLMPAGQMTTSLQTDPGKRQIILHQARTVGNVDEDKACRTKLAAEVVGDIDKLMTYWDQWSWHRVTFYGDLKTAVRHIAALTGYEVIEEA